MLCHVICEPLAYGDDAWGRFPSESYDRVRTAMEHKMVATLTRYDGVNLDSGKDLCQNLID